MDLPVPWKAYHRPNTNYFGEEIRRSHGALKKKLQSEKPSVLGDKVSGWNAHDAPLEKQYANRRTTRGSRTIFRERQLNTLRHSGSTSSKLSMSASEKILCGRNPTPHFIADRMRRNPVFDVPFGVLDTYTLSGERDRTLIEKEVEETSRALLHKSHVPIRLKERYGLDQMGGKFKGHIAFMSKMDCRIFFRLHISQGQNAVLKIQNWWRLILAKLRVGELKQLFTVTRYDQQTGMWYKANTRTGKSEWIY